MKLLWNIMFKGENHILLDKKIKMPYKIHKTKHFIRKRQFNPSKCRKETFRIKKVSPKTELVLCKKKHSQKQSIQSFLERR